MGYKDQIKTIIAENEVVLFMKGTANQPRCGFSKCVVDILNELGVIFYDVNILEDHPGFMQDLRDVSGWPTSPQLFINQELVGGCDLAQELYQTGELQKLLGITA